MTMEKFWINMVAFRWNRFTSGTLQTSGSQTNANRAVGQVVLQIAHQTNGTLQAYNSEVVKLQRLWVFTCRYKFKRCQRYFYTTYDVGTAPGTQSNDDVPQVFAPATNSYFGFIFIILLQWGMLRL